MDTYYILYRHAITKTVLCAQVQATSFGDAETTFKRIKAESHEISTIIIAK